MMKKNLVDAINEQIKFEFYSAQLYLAMASFCKSRDYDGFETWFMTQYEEENFHAMKFYRYLHERGEDVRIPGFEDPRNDFESLTDAFESSLEHEQLVTVAKGVVFHREAIELARGRIVEHINEKGELQSVDFKYLIDTSRKYAIPLLDYFDQIGLTRRSGYTRYLKSGVS